MKLECPDQGSDDRKLVLSYSTSTSEGNIASLPAGTMCFAMDTSSLVWHDIQISTTKNIHSLSAGHKQKAIFAYIFVFSKVPTVCCCCTMADI